MNSRLSGLSSGKLFYFYNNGREKTREHRLLSGDITGLFMYFHYNKQQQQYAFGGVLLLLFLS